MSIRSSVACQMRIKGALLLMLCILLTSILYCLLGDPQPTITDIVSETHRQLSHLKESVVPQQESDDIREERCAKYLRSLGFTQKPRLFPHDIWLNVTLPVFVTAVSSDQVHFALAFIKSFQDYIPDSNVFIYDLGLDSRDFHLINKACNASNTCSLRKFNFDVFPSHVADLKLFAYRPIILQEVLDQTGAALWLDPHYQLLPNANEKTNTLISQAQKEGILSWTIDQPTSSLTHPRMFEFFKTQRENYFFHRMIKPSHIILYNTEKIHTDLMLPWVRCALTTECIAPIGAQASGCRFNKKPLYRYSGCHHYDTSALNVVLGVMFNYNEKPYAANEEDKFFRKIIIDETNDLLTESDDDDYVTRKYAQRNNVSVAAIAKIGSANERTKIH